MVDKFAQRVTACLGMYYVVNTAAWQLTPGYVCYAS